MVVWGAADEVVEDQGYGRRHSRSLPKHHSVRTFPALFMISTLNNNHTHRMMFLLSQ